MENAPEIRRKLRSSLDMTVIRRDLVLVCVIVPLVLMFSGCTAGGLRDPDFWIIGAVVSALCILPFAGYSLWVIFQVYRHAENYLFFRVKLAQPHGSRWYRGAMYFTVVLEYPDGGKIVVNTRPIFQSYGWYEPLLENYLNKTVTIAYNEETEMVVVIG